MEAHGHSAPEWLAQVGLDPLIEKSPERPVPLPIAFQLFRLLATIEGPGASSRIVTPHSLDDLGIFGKLILTGQTPREALMRAVRFLPCYSTHELLVLRSIPGGLRVQAGWSLVLDDEMMHLSQQFTAALVVGLCLATNHASAAPKVIRIRPHPQAGVAHLRPLFGDALTASDQAVLSIDLNDTILDAPLHLDASSRLDVPPKNWTLPHKEASFSHSVSLTLSALNAEVPIRVEQVAGVAGMSVRSFQRMLAMDGSSFRLLADEIRRARTIETLMDDRRSGRLVAEDLGFSGQSALSRAVRRWTGLSPKHLRDGASSSNTLPSA
ncbi:helix-turn-helix domain-containing protein [Gemmobacter aquatilis]|nr:AraC family transcriptional regulator [Gemmobacter aquatilis]